VRGVHAERKIDEGGTAKEGDRIRGAFGTVTPQKRKVRLLFNDMSTEFAQPSPPPPREIRSPIGPTPRT
jgi:hypothetical protein